MERGGNHAKEGMGIDDAQDIDTTGSKRGERQMTILGVVLVWLAIAAVAFLVLCTLARLTTRGEMEAELGIVGDGELIDTSYMT